MSSNSSDAALVANLTAISTQLNRYLSIGIFFFGIIGNLLNCMALSHRTLRSNPCALLFLVSSMASLVTLTAGVAVRFLSGWSTDLTETNDWICRIRFFVLFTSRTIAFWLIALAMIDRWLSSSTAIQRRQMSSVKNARRGIVITIILSSLAYAQFFYCFEANLRNTPLKCYAKTGLCRFMYYLEFAVVTVYIPSSLMVTFGLLTLIDVRRSASRRVRPTIARAGTQKSDTKEKTVRQKRIEQQLLVMLCVHTVLVILFSLPQASQSLYTILAQVDTQSPLANAINNFLINLFILFTYITNGIPFYVYTLSGGAVFRQALFDALRDLSRSIRARV